MMIQNPHENIVNDLKSYFEVLAHQLVSFDEGAISRIRLRSINESVYELVVIISEHRRNFNLETISEKDWDYGENFLHAYEILKSILRVYNISPDQELESRYEAYKKIYDIRKSEEEILDRHSFHIRKRQKYLIQKIKPLSFQSLSSNINKNSLLKMVFKISKSQKNKI